MGLPIRNIVFDCEDTLGQADFWAKVTGYAKKDTSAPLPEEEFTILVDPSGSGLELFFNKVPETKTAKNRVHVDLAATDLEAEVQRLEGLGARQLQRFKYPGIAWAVMADPEGNEFCVGEHGE